VVLCFYLNPAEKKISEVVDFSQNVSLFLKDFCLRKHFLNARFGRSILSVSILREVIGINNECIVVKAEQ